MILSEGRNFLIDRPANGVWVARITRPDMRRQLNGSSSEDTPFYQDLDQNLLPLLHPENTLILNLGLLDQFTTELYQALLLLRQNLLSSRVCLILCNPSQAASETIKLRRADTIFELAGTEEEAVRRARGLGRSHAGDVSLSRFG